MIKNIFLSGFFCLFMISAASAQEVDSVQVQKLLTRYACKSCHFMESKPVGPGWKEIAERGYTKAEFIKLIEEPKPENWPKYPPMTPMGYVPDKDLEKIYNWVKTLKD
ncbi:MAG: cytochrome C [Cyclobacteriaceae bacterium]